MLTIVLHLGWTIGSPREYLKESAFQTELYLHKLVRVSKLIDLEGWARLFHELSGFYLILKSWIYSFRLFVFLPAPFSQTSVTFGHLLWLVFLLQECLLRNDTHTRSCTYMCVHTCIHTSLFHMHTYAHMHTYKQIHTDAYDFQSSKECEVDSTKSRLQIPYQITHVSFP